MHRLLERLDAGAATLVPLLYLAGLMLGTMAYFTDERLGMGLAVGTALAFAAELHSFLQQRRCRALWGQLTRTQDADARERIRGQFLANLAILAALVLFSAFNSIAFVASTWTPAPGWLPGWVQIGIRGAIIPAFFLLAGFLSPLNADAGALLASASHAMLHKAIHATVKQWRRRINRAQRRGLDLAPVAVSLMLDAGDAEGARRIAMIADGLAAAEAGAPAQLDAPSPTRRGAGMTYDALPAVAHLAAPSSTQRPAPGPDDSPTPPRPPRGGRGRPRRPAADPGAELGTVPDTGAGVVLLSQAPRARQPRRTAEALRRWREDTAAAARILAAEPDVSTRELARRLDWTPVRATEVRRAVQPVRSRREMREQLAGSAGEGVEERRPA